MENLYIILMFFNLCILSCYSFYLYNNFKKTRQFDKKNFSFPLACIELIINSFKLIIEIKLDKNYFTTILLLILWGLCVIFYLLPKHS